LSDDSQVEQFFADKADVSAYAAAAMDMMVFKGIYRGNGDGYFFPRKTATRAEAAMVMTRVALLLENVPAAGTLTVGAETYTLRTEDTIWLYQALHSSVWVSAEYAEYVPTYTLNLWGTEYHFAESASAYNGFNIVTSDGEYSGVQGKSAATSADLALIFEVFDSYCTPTD
jgi:5-keto 4-deoxyuronate isomerase